MVRSVDFLYSLYDALVSINVPNDKARAVVDAMERDMATHLATKSDTESLRRDMDAGFALMRKDMEAGFTLIRKDMEARFALMRKDMDALGSRLLIQLGALMVVLAGLMLGVLRLG